ncbi:MAG: methylmalonyl Co-A mutase-associated GTPase MeaB [Deltaproteobacteria bacterium]|nr:methylmalonyl Co-A mutase-associated GTPase MeaB [Deltaproteobacteria bacterium]
MEWIDRLLEGDQIAASKLISMVENKSPKIPEIMRLIHPYTGRSKVIGFTGPPGVGKSTLVDQFIYVGCTKELRLGVIAVDSSSPFSGGALLGDRVRMHAFAENENVFIRSMGTRGHLGGLSEASKGAIRILEALGCDMILVETVGVGQVELDIVKEVDTVLVVTMPSSGDYIQTMKAGIMEIADVFVVNKADLPGVDLTCLEIERSLDMALEPRDWRPPVIRTHAHLGEGIGELWKAVEAHRDFLHQDGRLESRRQGQIRAEMAELVFSRLREDFWSGWDEDPDFLELTRKVFHREMDLYAARDQVVHRIRKKIAEARISGSSGF